MVILVRETPRRIKKWLNQLMDHAQISSMFLVARSESLPELLENVMKRGVYFVNDLCLLLQNFPHIHAFRLTCDDLTVVFVGGQDGCLELRDLVFQNYGVKFQQLPHIKIWRLPEQSKLWLGSGVDLVVCELSRLCPWKPIAEYTFTVPDCVNQVLKIPDSPSDLLCGRHMRGPRRRILQAEKQGISYRYTHSLDDLRYFYDNMYYPFVKKRHGEKAQLASLECHMRWLELGGLILISLEGQPVAGSLVVNTQKICHGIEQGILHNDSNLIKNGVNALIFWCCILWAKEQGIDEFDLGGSHAQCSNGSFNFKAMWGSRVVPHLLNSRPGWTFLGNQLPKSLRQRLNQMEMIGEINGKFYCMYIPVGGEEMMGTHIQKAFKDGLDGVALVQPGSIQLVTTTPRSEP